MLENDVVDEPSRHAIGVVGLHLVVVLDVMARLEAIAREQTSPAVRVEVASGAEIIAARLRALQTAAFGE